MCVLREGNLLGPWGWGDSGLFLFGTIVLRIVEIWES